MNEKIINVSPGDKIVINVIASESFSSYTLSQAKSILGISRTTIYRAIKDKKLEIVMEGKTKKITHKSLTNYKK